jgi:hypothetical protein
LDRRLNAVSSEVLCDVSTRHITVALHPVARIDREDGNRLGGNKKRSASWTARVASRLVFQPSRTLLPIAVHVPA